VAIEELVDHSESVGGLIAWNHVSSIEDLQEVEVVVAASNTGGNSLNVPGVVFGGIESSLSRPLKGKGPGLVAHVVADEVVVSGVDENGHVSLQKCGDVRVEVVHPVRGEESVDLEVAISVPNVRSNTNRLSRRLSSNELVNIAEVVAEWRNCARDSNVIEIDASGLNWTDESVIAFGLGIRALVVVVSLVALGDLLNARSSGIDHLVENTIADELLDGVVLGVVSIVEVLNLWVSESVSDSNTVEVDWDGGVLLVLLVDVVADSGNVVPTVRFTSDVELLLLVLGVEFEPGLKEGVHVSSDLSLVGIEWRSIRVSSLNRLVNPHDIGLSVPGVGVEDGVGSVGCHRARSIFGEECDE